MQVGDIEVDQLFFDTFFGLWVEVITIPVDDPDNVIIAVLHRIFILLF